MPAALSYPGVYIEELPSGVRTIVGVATSIAAFVGRTQRGPVSKPIVINSYADFERKFGGLWIRSTLGYAVRDFYLNGGSQAVIVRLFSPSFKTEKDRTTALAAATPKAQAAADAVAKAATDAAGVAAPAPTAASVVAAVDAAVPAASAAGPAAAAAAKIVAKAAKDAVAVAASTAATVVTAVTAAVPTAVKAAADEAAGQTRKTALDAAAPTAKTAADAVAKAATDAAAVVAPVPTVASVVAAVNAAVSAASAAGTVAAAAAKSVAKAANDAAAVVAPAPTVVSVVAAVTSAVPTAITAAVDEAAPEAKAQLPTNGLALEAAYEGDWGNYLRARVDTDVSADVADGFKLDTSKLFNLTVRDTNADVTEIFRNVTAEESPRQVAKVLENESKLVRVKTPPGAMPTAHGAPAADEDIWKIDRLSSKVTTKASDGKTLMREDFTGAGKEGAKRGLYALKDADLFNLLCIPPHIHGGDIESQLIDDATAFCTDRRAMMLIDPPVGWIDKDAAKSGVDSGVGATNKNAAVFFPRLKQPNPWHDNQLEDFVPCGAVAGVFARTDTTRGVWKAPAGLDATLVGVPQLSVVLTDLENGELNKLGINCLRSMPAAGRVVWGSRTRVGDDRLTSEWKYIPVRRMALFLEESLYRSTHWVVFEPNDEPLWSQIRLNIGAFMHSLFRQGAFQGKTPAEAYLVKCDKETTTQDDVNRGIVNIVVGFAPLKPAEFVIIKLQQLAGQIQT